MSRGFVSFLFILIITFFLSGCSEKGNPAFDINAVNSYREIPGITDEEIAAIEKIKAQKQSFSYGILLSEEAYKISGDRHPGFTILLCDTLSGLFNIPFVPKMHNWSDLMERFDSFDIDFTNIINSTADVENKYFKTSPIIGTRLSVFAKEGGIEILSEYDLRGKRVGFFTGSYTESVFRANFPRVDFTVAEIGSAQEMAQKLEAGEIDAFVYDAPDVFTFYEYPHVVKAKSFPYVHVPVSITTANPDLKPVISAITKYLKAGGIGKIAEINAQGERNYSSFALQRSLNDEERAYIAGLKERGEKIKAGFTASRYPVAYYDEDAKDYKGIARDVLDEISALAGIEFEIAHDVYTGWPQLEDMLKTGEIKILSQLIPNDARKEYAIWPDTHYFTARYALLSNLNFPYLNLNQVPYVKVGLPAGTAEEAVYKRWFPDAEYISFRTTDEGLTALEKSEIDLYFCLDYTLLYESNFRENAGQKVNILFNNPVEGVPFGLNKDEVILCSIISKAQRIINTDRITRDWTSRVFDLSSEMAKDRVRYLSAAVICLLSLLAAMLASIIIINKLRKEAAESRGNLQALLDMLPVGIRIHSMDTLELIYSNKACLDVFGCSSFEEQVKGLSAFSFMPEYQPDGRKTADVIKEFALSDKNVFDIHCLKLNGEPFICRSTSCQINYAGRRASLGVMEDITAKEEQIRMLESTAQKEREANQLKTRFLTMMSHEIRTPMNAILGITEIQLQNKSLPADAEEALGRIYDSGNLLLNIINDILDLSKIEAGKLEIIPIKYNIPSFINDIAQLNRLRYEDKPIECKLEIDENTPLNLFGDELRLRQVLNNIISNAYKYTEKGSVTLSVSCELPKADENTVIMIFKVTDTGQGMSEDQLEKLFDEFTRFNLDKNRTVTGTGLGMNITKKILDLMGGEISVKSEPGKGSAFTIRLPQKRLDNLVCGKDTAEKLCNFSFRGVLSKKNQITREPMPHGRVLVVDDVETNIYVTRGMLLPYRLKVDDAISGIEALEKIKAGNEYDLIFMDHMMPKMDGVETVRLIREWEKESGAGRALKIIALTANAIVGQTEMFLKNGFDGYISKPIDSRELDRTLNSFIRNKKQPETAEPAREESASGNSPDIKKFFIMDAESAIEALEEVLGAEKMDFEQLETHEITVHGMKSALAHIGENELSAAALKLEKAAKEKDIAAVKEETPAFISALKELVKSIKRETGAAEENSDIGNI